MLQVIQHHLFVIKVLESNAEIVYLECNLSLYKDKCHLLISREMAAHVVAKTRKETIWVSSTACLLGMAIDSDLIFERNLSELCKIVNRKISV